MHNLLVCRFPVEKYPVLALKGAPAAYPVTAAHRHLQQYLQVSDYIDGEAQGYIDANFPQTKFIGIHLRNGADWVGKFAVHCWIDTIEKASCRVVLAFVAV